jgi:hypothetical protein
MKWLRVVVAGVLLLSVGVAYGAEDSSSGVGGRLRTYCDPVCELQSQDAAFSLLLETYRQFQSYQIETDYQNRLHAADRMNGKDGSLVIRTSSQGLQTLRSFVGVLAKEERDLRMQKLQTEVVNFHGAYGCARKVDEGEAGGAVASRVNLRTAANKLRNFVLLSSGPLAKADLRSARTISASSVLVDAAPVDPNQDEVIEPCD